MSEDSSRTNFGRSTTLRLDPSPLARAFVQFRTKYLYRDDVRQVNLLVYSRSGARRGFRVRLVTAPWSESRITFENAPRVSTPFIASGPIRPRWWKAVDVTPLVDYEDAEVSFALTTLAPNGLELASRETGLRGPRLVIELQSESD
ncbi:MAG TPA: DNRLRE domain-containing protein [Gaiellaceae bacterium]|nr:DNRLRE domain-containing protein [Gaiellaceae bacterium]